MKLGFVSAILPECSLEEVFQTAQTIGFDCVEIMCWPHGKAERRYAGVTHVDVDADAGANREQLAKLAEETGGCVADSRFP